MLLLFLPLAAKPKLSDYLSDPTILGALVLAFFGLFLIILFGIYGKLWLRARLSGVPTPMSTLVGMRLRNVNPEIIINARVTAFQAGINISNEQLESHYLARGDVPRVIRAIIAADRAKIDLPWGMGCAIDLAGRDVLDAVRISVNPKVIDVPRTGTIDAVAIDGIQLRCKARVTVRANLAKFVGGATEETVIARVGQGIVTTIGSAPTYQDVLENPDSISAAVLQQGLGTGTAFEILSIDIADIDVGTNIGAVLNADRAEADMRVAQAKAEERRAMAVARETEMKAKVQENRAIVVLAEAEIPKAISEAFRKGNLGVIDFYKLKNIQADTKMRESIGTPTSVPNKEVNP
jgi:uncharacterized protein YqfA (UPF0365 family)